MKKITVLLSDDHAVFREGLRSLLKATADIDVIGEAENGHTAVCEAKRLQPDVVVMDIAMPRLNGLEAARRIARQVPASRVLMLSAYRDEQYAKQAFEAGAAGYIPKEFASEGLLQAIRQACKKNPSFRPPAARRLLKQRQRGALPPKSKAAPALSSRQSEVLQLVAEGHTNKQIARLLSLSVKTVEKHRQAVLDKLDIHETATLTRYAVSHGIVQSSFTPIGGAGRQPTPVRA
jgi:DNA-binding NarL/FixJ family response regulator